MTKGNKRGGRRRKEANGDEDTDSGKDETSESRKGSSKSVKDLDFKERRELARQAAADRRRSKMKCHLCGKAGHVRRECPGIEDDGRGESKFTKSKGDSGATQLKSSTKGARNRGRKPSKSESSTESPELELPPGFSVHQDSSSPAEGDDAVALSEPYLYFDAGFDELAILEYLRSGRGKIKLSLKDAAAEYQRVMDQVSATSNYGGCLSRSIVKMNRLWSADAATCPDLGATTWFVVGLGREFCYNETDMEAAASCLLETIHINECVVGVFCDLDYSIVDRPGCDKESQLRRLRATCQAASEGVVPVQFRVSPSASTITDTAADTSCPYSEVIRDMEAVLLETTNRFPSLKVHLSCWSGRSEDMMRLLETFPENVWIGMDGSVSFSKAKQCHECAFDVPLSKLLLETGGTIPAEVARVMGQEAFSHPGLIPFVAEAVAKYKGQDMTADHVARATSANTILLYPQLAMGGH